ncbi:hypothetical protein [Mesorhizobium sp. CN2-181]|uniref:hypothetical protein n=1 Tax=Mesorhizobium yinganensis TaxID=3157707 RepID=UPI0032B796E4
MEKASADEAIALAVIPCHPAAMSVVPPKSYHAYPDRHIDCQEALEDEIKAPIARAQAAGWTLDDIARAVGDLLWAQMIRATERARRYLSRWFA